jgi:hypothetical protein
VEDIWDNQGSLAHYLGSGLLYSALEVEIMYATQRLIMLSSNYSESLRVSASHSERKSAFPYVAVTKSLPIVIVDRGYYCVHTSDSIFVFGSMCLEI